MKFIKQRIISALKKRIYLLIGIFIFLVGIPLVPYWIVLLIWNQNGNTSLHLEIMSPIMLVYLLIAGFLTIKKIDNSKKKSPTGGFIQE